MGERGSPAAFGDCPGRHRCSDRECWPWIPLWPWQPPARRSPFNADPAYRFLVAQARELGMSAEIENWTSADNKIRSYGPVRSLW